MTLNIIFSVVNPFSPIYMVITTYNCKKTIIGIQLDGGFYPTVIIVGRYNFVPSHPTILGEPLRDLNYMSCPMVLINN